MNLYGVVTGTNDYSLNVSFPNSFRLSVGDTITIRPLNANTGASTLDVGFGPMSLTLNGAALTSGQLEANKDRQCTFIGSGFALDSAGSGSGYTPSGNSSQILLGNGNASSTLPVGIVSAADIPGADTAVAHQVPTSDGAGGFTWEDQAGGTPTTDAGDLISGTLAAALLPGVLANVDTQAELLSAAAAAAASHAHVQADLPAQLYLEAQLSSQTLLSATAHPGAALTCATPTHNDCFTYSSGTWTATVAGWYEIAAYIYKYPYTGNSQINFKKNGSLYSGGDFLGSAGSILGTGAQTMMYLGVGDTFAACGVVSANIALDVSNLYYAFVRAFWRGR